MEFVNKNFAKNKTFFHFSNFPCYNADEEVDAMKNIFAERMRQTMFLKGIRQAELVDKTGIDKGSLSSYVNGRYMPNADKIAKIATALGV